MLNFFDKIFKRKNVEKISDESKLNEIQGKEGEDITISDGITIHTMPERFRFEHVKVSQARTAGFIIIIAGSLFIIAGAIFLYFYLFRTPKQEEKLIPTVKYDQTKELEQGKTEPETLKQEELLTVDKAKEAYLNMKSEFDKAENYDALEELYKKYGTENKLLEFYNSQAQIDILAGTFKEAAFNMIKQNFPSQEKIKEITGILSDNQAKLYSLTHDGKKEGTIIMVLENNIWKLDSESWKETKIAEHDTLATTSPELIQPIIPTNLENGIDSDLDGLLDKEEILVGSDINNIDTDGDTYNDLTEVLNLYNPIAKDRLIDNQNIKIYENKAFNYQLFYPKSWLISTVGGDDSVIFKSSDNHFFQVIVQPNADKQTIEDWYREQFNLINIDQANMISSLAWRGIKNNDNLTYYLTDLENKYIYTLSYNLATSNIIDYVNIFKALVKSFAID